MTRAELRPRGPYALRLSARLASDPTRIVRDGRITALVRVDERVELVRAWQRGDGSVVIDAESDGAVDAMRFVLGLDDDHSEFLARFARDPLLAETIRRVRGLRPVRVSTVAQALLRALAGQLVDWKTARRLERRVVAAVSPAPRDGLYAPPTTAALAGLSAAELRAHGLHARRTAALARLCRSLELERLRVVPTAAVAARLGREPGIGPWSIGVVCIEGLGRADHGLVGDLGLVKLCSALRGRWVETWETEELLAPYGEWAGLASVYLLEGYARGLVGVPRWERGRDRSAA